MMAMSMDQMNMMMARMHQQNYAYDMSLSQHFREISNTFASMAQSEYQAYQMHAQQMPGSAQQTMPGMGGMTGMESMGPMSGMTER